MNVRQSGSLLIVALIASAGCVSPEALSSKSFHYGMPSSPDQARQVQVIWENRVVTTQDVAHQGQPLLGLAGRVYFFGEEIGHPLPCKGTLTIDAHEVLADGQTKMIERWEIDPKTLVKLGRTDRIGWGYTVFLPWSTYRSDIARVQLQAKFVGESGAAALFSPPSNVTLRQEGQPVITSSVVPTAAAQIVRWGFSMADLGDWLRPRVRTMQIIALALTCGVVFFTAIAVSTRTGRPPADAQFLSVVSIAFFVAATVLSVVLPHFMVQANLKRIAAGQSPNTPQRLVEICQLKLIATLAVLEGSAFFSLVSYMTEGQIWTLALAAVAAVLMAMRFPTESSVLKWLDGAGRRIDDLRGDGEP